MVRAPLVALCCCLVSNAAAAHAAWRRIADVVNPAGHVKVIEGVDLRGGSASLACTRAVPEAEEDPDDESAGMPAPSAAHLQATPNKHLESFAEVLHRLAAPADLWRYCRTTFIPLEALQPEHDPLAHQRSSNSTMAAAGEA